MNISARIERLNKDLGTDTLLTEETLIRLPDALRRGAVPRVSADRGAVAPISR